TLHAQIKSMFLLWIGLSVLASGLFVTWLLESSYRESLMNRAAKEGALAASSLEDRLSAESVQSAAKQLGRTLDARVLIVGRDGKMRGDSESDPADANRLVSHPEVRRVLRTPPEQPVSYIRKGRIHVAAPVARGGREVGALL